MRSRAMSQLKLLPVIGMAVLAAPSIAQPMGAAPAQTLADAGVSAQDEIVVTAQKRQQSINDVGIAITAATGDQLRQRGIASPLDLPRLVPGFTAQQSSNNSVSYTLRGVGFFNSDLSTPPTVSIYQDEAPFPYPVMTKLVAFDLERVEVLKGPQGTLYGQNATGGAVNYIAAKPTESFEVGADLGYGRFNRVEGSFFMSGPMSDTLSARIAVRASHGGNWQQSTTRPGDGLGKQRQFQWRTVLDWHPSAAFASRLTLNVTYDGSDALAPQLYEVLPGVPAYARPELATYPIKLNARAADWNPEFDYGSDTNLYSLNWRNELEVADGVKLTAITAASSFHTKFAQEADGTTLNLQNIVNPGSSIKSIFQEIRLSGQGGRLNWLVGANYNHDVIHERQKFYFGDFSAARFAGETFVGPGATTPTGTSFGNYKVDTYGIYGHLEYKLTDTLTAAGGVRYTRDKRDYGGCQYGDAETSAVRSALQDALNGPAPGQGIVAGQCFVIDPGADYTFVDLVREKLNQHNISWKVGLDWKATPTTLVYASVSKGYKAGTIPVVSAATVDQFAPVPQESVLDFEGGVKAGMFDRRVQLNLSGFYYRYRDKQLRGSILDPLFGPLEALVTIPKSHVYGAEAQLVVKPVASLTIDTALTYVKSEIDRFIGFDGLGVFGNQAGTPFPFAPKWQTVSNIDYRAPILGTWDAFVGTTITTNSRTNSAIGAPAVRMIDGYALVDLRAGVESSDGRYRFAIWGKNVTNKYYWTNAFLSFDDVVRFTGEPATFGATFSFRFR